MVISTQAATDADLLSIWIDDALKSGNPKTVCHLYTADKDADLEDEEQWAKANDESWEKFWKGDCPIVHFIGGDIIYHHCIFCKF